MKKVLIWDISFKLANVGGPAGYLYNIHEYLKEHPNPQIVFLSDIQGCQVTQRNQYPPCVSFFEAFFYKRINSDFKEVDVTFPEGFDLNVFDAIHFHMIPDILGASNILCDYNGKKILTPHSPCSFADEILVNRSKIYRYTNARNHLINLEIESYKLADYIFFPCSEAREPYFKVPKIAKYFKENENKFIYNPSAILDIKINEENIQKYEDIGIPKGAFVITYFGRHNYIKGYDVLKDVCMMLIERNPEVYVICAGKGVIEAPKHDRWIELGFINNTHELLYQSDLYILPNRETYFDLVVLEILRSSTVLMLSDTGGNRYFKSLPKDEIDGLTFFDIQRPLEIVDSAEKIIKLKKNDSSTFNELRSNNRSLFLKYFTIEKWVDRYINVINHL